MHKYNNHRLITFVVILLVFFPMLLPAKDLTAGVNDNQRHFILRLESGPVWQGRNDVKIPNDRNGTRYSLTDLVGNGPYPAGRFYFTWRINNKHGLRLLLAPLSYTSSGTFDSPVSFAGQNFSPDRSVDATYKFNSFRLTYHYKYYHSEQWRWWIGFTAKIRDAKIKLEQENISSEKTDLGFVPLLHLRGEYHPGEKYWILFDMDALAGGPGRAEDATIQLGYNLNDNWSISAGYRTVEGGADVEEVYTFAWLHYIVASVNFSF
ncbi:hypothetical protein JXQ31_11245 [candidate division KSB1 bacterium]|nr:hypothetical protein [candidate division KSB1 bacterium]